MDGFPSTVRCQSTTYLRAGKTTALRANATHEETREREERGVLVAAQNSPSGFSSRLQPREFRIELESYRFYTVDFYFSLF
jgi:hypothetical protein